MKALQIFRDGETSTIEIPTPEPGLGEVRIRIDAVTICTQWDLHLLHDRPMFPGHTFHYPYTIGQPGHEASGVVDEVGDGVTSLSKGDRVSLWRDPGHHIVGCYAEYAVRPIEDVIKVPDWLSADLTAPIELAMCVACSVLRMISMDAIRGKRTAVAGLGPAGLIAIQMLRAEGAASIVAIDPVEKRRDLALELGADFAYSPEEAQKYLPDRSNAALDSAIDCVGSAKSAHFLMDHVDDVVALFGVQREEYTFAFRHYNGLRLCGYPPHNRGAAEYAVKLLNERKLDFSPMISHRLPMNEYPSALKLLERQEATKICLVPW